MRVSNRSPVLPASAPSPVVPAEAKAVDQFTRAAGAPAAAPVAKTLPKKSEAKFDYVVAGGGAAGAVTAARLAEQGYRVLILEGGADTEDAARPARFRPHQIR